jgi:hypothetical protein
MKKVYETPNADLIVFATQDVLAASGEDVIINDGDKGGNKTEIGNVPLF